jgi:hypothetical protein
MNIKRNLLYETWTTGLRGWWISRLLKKRENTRKLIKYKCTYITNTYKDCDLLQDRPVLPSGTTPHHDNTATVLTIAKIWLRNPEWLNAKTDWLTYWLIDRRHSQSNSWLLLLLLFLEYTGLCSSYLGAWLIVLIYSVILRRFISLLRLYNLEWWFSGLGKYSRPFARGGFGTLMVAFNFTEHNRAQDLVCGPFRHIPWNDSFHWTA